MNIGDFLDNNKKKSLLLPDGIIVGTVIRAFVNFTNPPKEKRFIVVGFHEDRVSLTSVLINTKINLIVNYTPELACEHLFFVSEGRPYLSYDSFVDCSEIHTIRVSEISNKIDENPSMVLGQIEKQDLDKIIRQIVESPIIKGKIKKRCGIYNYNFEN